MRQMLHEITVQSLLITTVNGFFLYKSVQDLSEPTSYQCSTAEIYVE